MKKIKVLHCIHSLFGGGAETQLRIIANNSDSYGFVSAVACFDDGAGEYLPNAQKYISIKSHKSLVSSIKFFADSIEHFNPDVVHVWLPAPVTIPAMIAAKRNRKKVVFSYRNKMFFYSPKIFVEFIFASLFSDQIVSNNPVSQSSFMFRVLARLKNAEEIPNAINTVFSNQWSRNKEKCNYIRVLCVGRLTPQKNTSFLLKALSKIDKDKWSLSICGTGEEGDNLKDLTSSLGVESNVYFLGYRDDVHEIMLKHDVLIMPSTFEGMPNVVAEAMAIGLPCVLSDIPSHRWIAGDSNIPFFDLSDEHSLNKIVFRVLDDDAFLNIVSNSAYDRSTCFTVDKLLNNYTSFYKKVVGGLDESIA